MPANVTQSEFLAAMGDSARRAAEAAKNRPPDYGNMDLPAGIEGGIAELRDMKLTRIAAGKTNAGKWMFYAAGVVRAPAEHNGVPIEGLRTSITENLFDTPQSQGRKTKDEHVVHVQNQLKILGVPPDMLGIDRWEEAIKTLLAIRPRVTFRFRTWKGRKETTGPYAGREPRTNHQWGGKCAWNATPEAPAAGFSDGTARASANGAGKSAPAAAEPEPEDGGDDVPADTADHPPPSGGGEAEEVDFDALVESAKAKNAAAQRRLTELAVEAGADQEAVDAAASWEEVAEMARGGPSPGLDSPVSDEEEPPQEEPAEPEPPAKGAHYGYCPPDPKTGRASRVAVACEVMAVNKAKRTVDLRLVKNPKIAYKAVSWDDLVGE